MRKTENANYVNTYFNFFMMQSRHSLRILILIDILKSIAQFKLCYLQFFYSFCSHLWIKNGALLSSHMGWIFKEGKQIFLMLQAKKNVFEEKQTNLIESYKIRLNISFLLLFKFYLSKFDFRIIGQKYCYCHNVFFKSVFIFF